MQENMEPMVEVEKEITNISTSDFYSELAKKVSGYNAKLLLSDAMVRAGQREINDNKLAKEDVKNICLELIKKGGPAFYVGKAMYSNIQ